MQRMRSEKRNRRTKGETLVETVVAFGVLMIMLALLATALRGAAQINRRAAEQTAILDADCTLVEQDMGQAGAGLDTLTLTPKVNGAATMGEISIPLEVRKGELLYYFLDDATAENGDG